MADLVCTHCGNRDRTLMEPRILYLYTLWLCLVCSKEWREPAPKEVVRADA
jgi:hypothetical protein